MKKIGGRGGMSLTTGFDVKFSWKSGNPPFMSSWTSEEDYVTMFCDEAQLPNVQSAVGQRSGRHLGEGPVSYPHTRIFTDISLGFLIDGNASQLKFFNSWYNFIFGELPRTEYSGSFSAALSDQTEPLSPSRVNRLAYLDDYAATVKIIKTEPNGAAPNGRAPITYALEKCYPYSIDTVPLSYGSSQVARATINFYYSRHTVSYGTYVPNYKSSPLQTGMTLLNGTIRSSVDEN